MRDYNVIIAPSTLASLIESELYDDMEEYPGNLLDNYIFTGTEKTCFGNIRPRKYIIVKENYATSQSSKHVMLLTDKKELVEAERNYFKSSIH